MLETDLKLFKATRGAVFKLREGVDDATEDFVMLSKRYGDHEGFIKGTLNQDGGIDNLLSLRTVDMNPSVKVEYAFPMNVNLFGKYKAFSDEVAFYGAIGNLPEQKKEGFIKRSNLALGGKMNFSPFLAHVGFRRLDGTFGSYAAAQLPYVCFSFQSSISDSSSKLRFGLYSAIGPFFVLKGDLQTTSILQTRIGCISDKIPHFAAFGFLDFAQKRICAKAVSSHFENITFGVKADYTLDEEKPSGYCLFKYNNDVSFKGKLGFDGICEMSTKYQPNEYLTVNLRSAASLKEKLNNPQFGFSLDFTL